MRWAAGRLMKSARIMAWPRCVWAWGRARPPLWSGWGSSLLLVGEAVAHPARGENKLRLLGIALNLAAQVVDIELEAFQRGAVLGSPHLADQLAAREHAAGILRQLCEQSEVGGRQVYSLPVRGHFARGQVDV